MKYIERVYKIAENVVVFAGYDIVECDGDENLLFLLFIDDFCFVFCEYLVLSFE